MLTSGTQILLPAAVGADSVVLCSYHIICACGCLILPSGASPVFTYSTYGHGDRSEVHVGEENAPQEAL